MKSLKFLLFLLLVVVTPSVAQQPLRNQFTTNQAMNAVQDGWASVWNATAARWSNANISGLGGDAGGTNARQFGSANLTNLNTTTNLAITYNLSTAISNVPNFSVVNVQPGTNSITPAIVLSTGLGGINSIAKTNVIFNGFGTTLSGRAAPGEIWYFSNCVNIIIDGFTFDGLVITNYTLAPEFQWGLLSFVNCDNITIRNCRVLNGHNFGILDIATLTADRVTTNIFVRQNYFYNCGSQYTNFSVAYDGAAVELTDGIVEDNFIDECLRGIEFFENNTTGRVYDRGVARRNTIRNTLNYGIFALGYTNSDSLIIENNLIINEQGYTRRGSNYHTDATGIYIGFGNKHKIWDNIIIGTNYGGIFMGGNNARMDDLSVVGNRVEGFDNGIVGSVGDANYSFNLYMAGNQVKGAKSPFVYGGIRNGNIIGNQAYDVMQSGNPAFNFYSSGNFRSTNVLVTGNVATDTQGNMDFGYSSGAFNSNIVFGVNQSIGGTGGQIEGAVGINVVLRGHVGSSGFPEFSEKTAMTAPVFIDRGESFEPIELGFWGTPFGFTNRNTTKLSLFNYNPFGDDWAVSGNLGVFDEAYGPSWNGSTNVPTKNALYDKIESLSPGGGGGAFNTSQFSATSVTNIKTRPEITNIFNYSTLVVTGALASIDIDTGSVGERWLFDPAVGALNYFGSDAYIGLNSVPFFLMQSDSGTIITNLDVQGTNTARWLKLVGVPAGSLLRTDVNTNVVAATIGTGLGFDGTTLSVQGLVFTTNQYTTNISGTPVIGSLWFNGTNGIVGTNEARVALEYIPIFRSLRMGEVAGGQDVYNQVGFGSNFWNTTNIGRVTVGFGSNALVQGHYSSVLGGSFNMIRTNARFSVIGGGQENMIDTNASSSVIAGGGKNSIQTATVAGGEVGNSTISGGSNNIINGTTLIYATIGGGGDNRITSSREATISGGFGNVIEFPGRGGFVGGGINNQINGSVAEDSKMSVVAGGEQNALRGTHSFIGSGFQNNMTAAGGSYNSIVGGQINNIGVNPTFFSTHAFIGGGFDNNIDNDVHYGVIVGGRENNIGGGSTNSAILGGAWNVIQANAPFSTILSGFSNNITASGDHGVILGGFKNQISGSNSFAVGNGITNGTDRSVDIGYGLFGGIGNKIRVSETNLHLIGGLKILMTNGAVNGHVLTSDANGVGSWAAPTAGTTSLTNQTATSYYPGSSFMLDTNVWVSGTNTLYTNVFNSVANGITNLYVTNIFDGQTIRWWVFPSNGVTVGFPQFILTDHLDGSIVTPATNIWSEVEITRRGNLTNINVKTATYTLDWGNVVATTNFATRTITLTAPSGSGTPAGSTLQVQYNSNNLFDADATFFYNVLTNELVVSNNVAYGPKLSLKGDAGREFSFKVEDGTNRIVVNHASSDHVLLIEMGALGSYRMSTNAFRPPQHMSTDLGLFTIRWANGYFGALNTTNIVVLGHAYITNQVLYAGEVIAGGTAATNLDFTLGTKKYVETNIFTDVTYTFTNAVGGSSMEIMLKGSTNTAANRTVTFAASGGAVISHLSGTNGVNSFTLYSNTIVRVAATVFTNLTGTNILMKWETDSFWPQPNAPIYAIAGASTSNMIAGGLMYYDHAPAPYTNHSSAGLNYTNLAVVTIPAHTLTNLGDSITGVWRGRFRGANNGTNQLIVGYGTATNIFDTGTMTNTANVAWELGCEITRTGDTNQSIYAYMRSAGVSSLSGGYTNAQIVQPLIVITNGATNVFRLQARGFGAGAVTNDFFKVYYQPGIR